MLNIQKVDEVDLGKENMRLTDVLRKLDGVRDKVRFGDILTIKLRKNGRTIKEWSVVANTWTAIGRQLIRDALCDGGFTKISYMYADGKGGTAQGTTNSKPAPDKARFVATWSSSGSIADITSFSLRQTSDGSDLATVAVNSFDKPDGVELQVTWTITVS